MHGRRPKRPNDEFPSTAMSDAFWNLVECCWTCDPTDRPSVAEICTYLKELHCESCNDFSSQLSQLSLEHGHIAVVSLHFRVSSVIFKMGGPRC